MRDWFKKIATDLLNRFITECTCKGDSYCQDCKWYLDLKKWINNSKQKGGD